MIDHADEDAKGCEVRHPILAVARADVYATCSCSHMPWRLEQAYRLAFAGHLHIQSFSNMIRIFDMDRLLIRKPHIKATRLMQTAPSLSVISSAHMLYGPEYSLQPPKADKHFPTGKIGF
jgi:hypothetical protein